MVPIPRIRQIIPHVSLVMSFSFRSLPLFSDASLSSHSATLTSGFFSRALIMISVRLLVSLICLRVTSQMMIIGKTVEHPMSQRTPKIPSMINVCLCNYTLFLFEHVHIYNRTNEEKVTCYFSQSSICRIISSLVDSGQCGHTSSSFAALICDVCSCDQCNFQICLF